MASRPQRKMKVSFDEPVQNQKNRCFVIPANGGIQAVYVVPVYRVMAAKKPALMPRMAAFDIFDRPTVNRQLETVNFHTNVTQ